MCVREREREREPITITYAYTSTCIPAFSRTHTHTTFPPTHLPVFAFPNASSRGLDRRTRSTIDTDDDEAAALLSLPVSSAAGAAGCWIG